MAGRATSHHRTSAINAGFTLIEVLVALAVIATVLGASVHSAGNNASNAGRLRDRTVASWVAQNRLAEMQLQSDFPALGKKNGDEEMFGKKWYWRTTVQKVEDEDLRRVDVQVLRDKNDQNSVFTLAGFVSHPRLNSRQRREE